MQQLQLQAAGSAFSLASVPLINSRLSSVTNVSLPSSSPGEEGGVFNVQFVLWIDVCWHRLSPPARTVRSHRALPPNRRRQKDVFWFGVFFVVVFFNLRGTPPPPPPPQIVQPLPAAAGPTD